MRQAAPDAAIIMMSAVLDGSVKARAVADGARGFLVKPFDRDSITMTFKADFEASAFGTRICTVPNCPISLCNNLSLQAQRFNPTKT